MIHRENERSEHQKIRGVAYTLTFGGLANVIHITDVDT